MLSEKYKDALIEAAVSGGELAPAVRAHVDSCANCADELAQQRSLMGAIDANVSRQMNAPVPAAMPQRFEAYFAQQPRPKLTPRLGSIFVGGFAVLAAAAIIVAAFVHTKNEAHESRRIATAPPSILSSNPKPAQAREAELRPTVADGRRREAPSRARSRIIPVSNANASVRTEPELIMPADERVAFEYFIAKSKTRDELVAALMAPLRRNLDEPVKHIEIPDINTAGIVIQPIGEETRR